MAKRKKSSRTGKNKGQARRQKIVKPSNRSEEYASTPIEEIVKKTTSAIDIKELIKMVNVMRSGAKARIKSIEKAGLYSYAADKFAPSEKTVREMLKGKTAVEQRNILVQEFARYQAFFESKTATKEGIREIELEQDIRIFGVDRYGKPNASLPKEARMKYWALFSEYSISQASEATRLGSDRLQQMIGSYMMVKAYQEGDEFPYIDMLEFLKDMGA